MERTRDHDTSAGVCIIVTPAGEAVPRSLAEALTHHDATPVHAPSPYHAITRVARTDHNGRCTLLIVEPERCAHADALALAAMAHTPDIAVWRYEPDDDSPVAPYVPDKPGVVPEPLVADRSDDVDDHDTDDDDDHEPDSPPDTIAFTMKPGEPRLPKLADEGDGPADDDASDDRSDESDDRSDESDNTPLVSHDELSMLLGDDDPEEDR